VLQFTALVFMTTNAFMLWLFTLKILQDHGDSGDPLKAGERLFPEARLFAVFECEFMKWNCNVPCLFH
jgi:hypothetical protein